MLYGVLIACCNAIEEEYEFCMVQVIEVLRAPNGTQLQNEFDCPIASLTNEIFIVEPINIIQPVSIVHLCSDSCKISTTYNKTRQLEREQVKLSKEQAIFKHDPSNNLYCINIFCTGNYQ